MNAIDNIGPKNTGQLAALLGYHEETIRRLIREGRIRALRFGRNYRIPADEVARIMTEGLPSLSITTGAAYQ